MRDMVSLAWLMESAAGISSMAEDRSSLHRREGEYDGEYDAARIWANEQQQVLSELLEGWDKFAMDYNSEPIALSDREKIQDSILQILTGTSGVWDEENYS